MNNRGRWFSAWFQYVPIIWGSLFARKETHDLVRTLMEWFLPGLFEGNPQSLPKGFRKGLVPFPVASLGMKSDWPTQTILNSLQTITHFLSSWTLSVLGLDHFSGRSKARKMCFPIHSGSEQTNIGFRPASHLSVATSHKSQKATAPVKGAHLGGVGYFSFFKLWGVSASLGGFLLLLFF